MKWVLVFIIYVFFITCFVNSVLAAPKEIYTDPETGKEVWRMTNEPVMDLTQYYHHPTMSPNGRYLIFRTSRGSAIYIINSDGSGERAIGDYWVWNSPSVGRGIDFSTNNLQGWWSGDSKTYYVFSKLYAIDIEKFLSNMSADEYIWQVSSTHASDFYFPMLSPDGRRLFGLSNSGDTTSGATLKLINVDGTNYQEFDIPYYYWDNLAIDVTHGWLGNDEAWYMNNLPPSSDPNDPYRDIEVVFDANNGSYKGILPIDDNDGDLWDGLFDHPILSPSGYYIGNGEGRIAGGGRGGILSANTKYWIQEDVGRELILVGSYTGNHQAFGPDGKFLVAGDTISSNKGLVVVWPVPPDGSGPIKVARYQDASSSDFDSAYATFSPDGTKIIFTGSVREASNRDIYIAVFKKPDAPSSLTATNLGNGQMSLSWKPAKQHREIKEYEVYKASSQSGPYVLEDIVPELVTYLEAPSNISATDTTINVDSTEGFPPSGYIEISGLSTEKPTEIIQYTSKTGTSFNGCTRGAKGTTPAEHWNDAFVWKCKEENGYTGSHSPGDWFRVRSVEWSGLRSDYSQTVNINDLNYSGSPADLNEDGVVNIYDIVIVAAHFGKTHSHPQWNDTADVYTSNEVDIYDVVFVASRFGATSPPPCTPKTEICGNGIDEDCDGYDLPCSGRALYVSTSGSDSYDGLYPAYQGGDSGPFLTVQKALTDSVEGDTIFIAAGTYDLAGYSTHLYKSISLIGQSRDTTILTNGDTLYLHKKIYVKNLMFRNYLKEDYTSAVFRLAPSAAEIIEGMTIDSCAFEDVPGVVSSFNYAGTMRNISITNNLMTDINNNWMTNAVIIRDGIISDINVSGNTIRNIYSNSPSHDVIVIYLGRQDTSLVDRVTVSDNIIETIRGGSVLQSGDYTPGGRGILAYGNNINILNNRISDFDEAPGFPRNCIYIKASNSIIAGNVAHNCGASFTDSGAGSGDITIKGEGNFGNQIYDNKITGDQLGIALFTKGEINLTNNYVKKPLGNFGIYSYELADRLIYIYDNYIEVNKRTLTVYDAAGGEVTDNVFITYNPPQMWISNSPNVSIHDNIECIGTTNCQNLTPTNPTCQNLGYVCCESCSGSAYPAYDANCEYGGGKCCASCS